MCHTVRFDLAPMRSKMLCDIVKVCIYVHGTHNTALHGLLYHLMLGMTCIPIIFIVDINGISQSIYLMSWEANGTQQEFQFSGFIRTRFVSCMQSIP